MRAKHFITESGKIHPTMVAFLKQKGFTGPYLLRNLPKWYKEMFGNDKEYNTVEMAKKVWGKFVWEACTTCIRLPKS